jgi:hypothetical protein
MFDAFSFKRTSRLPSREMTLKSAAAFDLTLASSIKFVYRALGGTGRNEIVAVVVDATANRIRVDFADADVATVGQYEWHVEAVFAAKTMCFPESGFYTFSVTEMIEA